MERTFGGPTTVRSTSRVCDRGAKKSWTPWLVSSAHKFDRFRKRKPRSQFSRHSTSRDKTSGGPWPTSTVPKDTAAHFGAFYGLQEASGKELRGKRVANIQNTVPLARSAPRLEFTRQMVRKLERAVGSEDYERQVRALFEETVEPADFKTGPLPPENSIPVGRECPSGFPLWYKEPCKTRSAEGREFSGLGYESSMGRLRDVFEESSNESSNVDEDEEEDEEAQNSSSVDGNPETGGSVERLETLMSVLSSSRSGSANKTKN